MAACTARRRSLVGGVIAIGGGLEHLSGSVRRRLCVGERGEAGGEGSGDGVGEVWSFENLAVGMRGDVDVVVHIEAWGEGKEM